MTTFEENAEIKLKVLPGFAVPSPTREQVELLASSTPTEWESCTDKGFKTLMAERKEADFEIGLLAIPKHLHEAWWEAAEILVSPTENGVSSPQYETFVGAVTQFLRYKNVQLDESMRCEVVVRATGKESQYNSGVRSNITKAAKSVCILINLSDDPTKITFSLPRGDVTSISQRHRKIRISLNPRLGFLIPGSIDYTTCSHSLSGPEILLRIL